MRSTPPHRIHPATAVLVLGLLLAAAPASAQWSRVTALPPTFVFALQARADTIVAGVDTATYVSTDAGAHWTRSARPAPAVVVIDALWLRNGRLFVGTAGQGVFVSDDLGTTWQPYNQGLVGGFLDSQLDVSDLQARGDSLYAATEGAGVYVRGFAAGSTWSHFGDVFEPSQASNVDDLTLGGNRLLAAAGGNGTVFSRDPGAADWTESFLDNVGLEPGLQARAATWTGTAFLAGTNIGAFRSPTGQEPWTFTGPNLGSLGNAVFAARPGQVFGAFDRPNSVFIEHSDDDGVTWQLLEEIPSRFVFQMALRGTDLYAARNDGLWLRSTADVAVLPGGAAGAGLRFAVAGAQPVGDDVRFRFELDAPAQAVIEVFDARGRRVGARIDEALARGPHEVAWPARGLAPGVYAARLSAGGRRAVARIVRTR